MKPSIFVVLCALLATGVAAPAQAASSTARNQGLLSEVDQNAIESMRSLMGDRADAQYAIGRLYERGGLNREAVTWMKKSADGGYPMAKAWLSQQKVNSDFRNSRGRMLAASRRGIGKRGE